MTNRRRRRNKKNVPPVAKSNATAAPPIQGAVAIGHRDAGVLPAGYTLSGQDRFCPAVDCRGEKPGTIVIDKAFVLSDLPRCSRLASGFQKVRFVELRFLVAATASSMTSGSFVAAVVPDYYWFPQQAPDAELMATRGSKVSQFFRSTSVVWSGGTRSYYTSFDMEEPRTSVPVRFCLAVVTQATASAQVVVEVAYRVHFHSPAVEDLAPYVPSFRVLKDFTWQTGTGTSFRPYIIAANGGTATDSVQLTTDDFYPKLPVGARLLLPRPATLQVDSSEEYGEVVGNYIYAETEKKLRLCRLTRSLTSFSEEFADADLSKQATKASTYTRCRLFAYMISGGKRVPYSDPGTVFH